MGWGWCDNCCTTILDCRCGGERVRRSEAIALRSQCDVLSVEDVQRLISCVEGRILTLNREMKEKGTDLGGEVRQIINDEISKLNALITRLAAINDVAHKEGR